MKIQNTWELLWLSELLLHPTPLKSVNKEKNAKKPSYLHVINWRTLCAPLWVPFPLPWPGFEILNSNLGGRLTICLHGPLKENGCSSASPAWGNHFCWVSPRSHWKHGWPGSCENEADQPAGQAHPASEEASIPPSHSPWQAQVSSLLRFASVSLSFTAGALKIHPQAFAPLRLFAVTGLLCLLGCSFLFVAAAIPADIAGCSLCRNCSWWSKLIPT